MTTYFASHGRGGAGNIASFKNTPKLTARDLETPTLKTSVVTTGRGGSGNMMSNSDPYETRLMQDVQPVQRRTSSGASYSGRGGAGNVFSEPADLIAARDAKNQYAVDDSSRDSGESRRSGDLTRVISRGKEILFGRK